MKSLFSIGFVLLALHGFGQRVIVSAATEMTVAGYEAGGVISYKSKGSWRTGVFYQQSLPTRTEFASTNTFWGLVNSIPLVKTEKLKFYGVIRTGMVNQKFFVLTPGLETDLSVGNYFSVGAGFAIRKTYPSASLKINFIL